MATDQSTIQDVLATDETSDASTGGQAPAAQPSQDPDPDPVIASLRRDFEGAKQRAMFDVRKCVQCRKVPVLGNRITCDGCQIDKMARSARSEQIPTTRMCPKCGERPIMGRNKSCDMCRIAPKPMTEEQKERRRRASAARVSAREARGHCRKCDTPAAEGKKHCEMCLAKGRAWFHTERIKGLRNLNRQARRLEALEKGLCPGCMAVPPEAGRLKCKPCNQIQAKKVRERRGGTRTLLLEEEEGEEGEENDEDEENIDNNESDEDDGSGIDNIEGTSRDARDPEERNKLRNAINRTKWNDYNRKRREEAQAKGLCARCWTRQSRLGANTCEPCLLKRREQQQRSARAKKDAQFLLSHGINDVVDPGEHTKPCGSARTRRKAKPRHPTSPSHDDGDEQEQGQDEDKLMVDASEDDSDWGDHDEPKLKKLRIE
ncbi:hypothetical protein PG996_010481 [Apiospora saccharicola]|uniref:Stc1 domain-containing protein n=1 Tax=Apiospora saccharicola TaxID=335842 RepID=A0ABR1UNR4_9PEZI